MSYINVIKELREKMFLTQKEFSKIIGVSYETINRWENGRFNPSMKEKKKIYELCQKYSVEYREDKNEQF